MSEFRVGVDILEMAMSDDALIRDYAHTRSSSAFAALVERHLNLVYSVARRHVRSDALAQEVTQAVFVDLACAAMRWEADTPVVAWLHLVARRTAIDVVRREARRQAREQIAAEMADAMSTPEPAWTEVEPLLDEAVEALAPPDRTAILLRFFENKSLREVGAALGTSDDAAQKRVSRALEELRAFFARRGVAITAAGLVATLTTHAIVSAPVGLSAAVTSAGAIVSTATAEVARTIVMTTLQKSLVAASFILVAGFGLHEATGYVRQGTELAAGRARSADLAAQLQRDRVAHEAAAKQLRQIEDQIDLRLPPPAATPADLALEEQARNWMKQLERLRQLIDQRPELRLPEKAALPDPAWLAAAGQKLETDEDVRRVVAQLRGRAENQIVTWIHFALTKYLQATAGVLPDRVDQLVPYFDPPIDPQLLERFEVLRAGKVSDLRAADRNTIIAVKEPIDVEYDNPWVIGLDSSRTVNAMNQTISEAQTAFAAANGGRRATLAGELAPFLKWPIDPTALQKHLTRTAALRGTP